MAIGTPTDLGGSNISGIATTNTVSLTTTVQADIGDTVIVCVASSTTGRTLSSVADNVAGGTNSYSVDVTSNDGTNTENAYIVSCRVTSTMPVETVITATFANSVSSVRAIAAFKVGGVSSGTRLDVTASSTGTSSGWTATASGPTSQADELLVSFGWQASGTSSNTPGQTPAGVNTYIELPRDGGGTMDFNGSSRTFAVEYLIVSSTNTYRAAGTWSSAGSRWRAALATYKADIAGAFTNTVPPTITGTLTVGQVLTCNDGTWTPTPGSFSRQWQRADDNIGTNTVSISGATGGTYTIDSADSNKYLRVEVLPNVT